MHMIHKYVNFMVSFVTFLIEIKNSEEKVSNLKNVEEFRLSCVILIFSIIV